jgi:hypothetical protein
MLANNSMVICFTALALIAYNLRQNNFVKRIIDAIRRNISMGNANWDYFVECLDYLHYIGSKAASQTASSNSIVNVASSPLPWEQDTLPLRNNGSCGHRFCVCETSESANWLYPVVDGVWSIDQVGQNSAVVSALVSAYNTALWLVDVSEATCTWLCMVLARQSLLSGHTVKTCIIINEFRVILWET